MNDGWVIGMTLNDSGLDINVKMHLITSKFIQKKIYMFIV